MPWLERDLSCLAGEVSSTGKPPRNELTTSGRAGSRQGVAGAVVVAAVLVVSGTVSVPLPPGGMAVTAILLGLLTVGASLVRIRAAIQAALFADGLLLCLVLGAAVSVLWPVPAAAASALALLAAARWRSLRPATPWLHAGHRTPELPWLMAVTLVVSAATLVVFLLVTGRFPSDGYLRMAQEYPLVLTIVGGLGFALLNATAEEVVFRGVFQAALMETVGVPLAVAIQAIAFGLVHLGGVPGGPLGAVLAGSWGLVLGIIRVRTGGLLYAWILHVAADITIVTTLAVLLR